MLKATSAPTIIWSLSTNNAPNAPTPTLMPGSRLVTTLRAPAAVWSSDRLLLAASSVWRCQRSIERQRLDRRHAIEDLEQKGLAAALDFVDLGQPLAERARHCRQHDKGGRRDAEHDQGQLPRIEQQHRQINDDREKIEKRIEQPARQEVADVVRLLELVGRDPGWVGMEIIYRHAQQMLDRAVGDLVIEAARNEGEQVIAQIIEAGVEQDQHPDPGTQRIEGRERLVRHDLV